MRFVTLGYMDENKWNAMSKTEQEAMVEECFAYDETLFRQGHWVADGGEALKSARTAKTLRTKGGKVVVTDGPYAETKEQLGGLGVLEADSLDQAALIMSRHPGVRLGGPFEIRPIDEAFTQRCQSDIPPSADLPDAPKFVCLGYSDESKWSSLSPAQLDAMVEECIAYGRELGKHGQWVGGIALQPSSTAKTLRSQRGKVLVTDGPFAETKELLGGVATFRFRNIDEAVAAWSNHPCLRIGDTLELRPADMEFSALFEAKLGHVKRQTAAT